MAKPQSVASMTGFARQEGADAALSWTWEVKSVNGKSLDIRFRLPPGYESLDAPVRALVPQHCARGNLQIGLSFQAGAQEQRFRINQALLDQLIGLAADMKAREGVQAPRLDGLLAVRGVVELAEEEESAEVRAARDQLLLADLTQAIKALVVARRAEGKRLKTLLEGHLARITTLVTAAEESAAAQPEALRERLRLQLEELLAAAPALPEDRLAQESAVLIAKADVREELDRLKAHLAAAADLLAGGGPIGRRLDFLCQEFNREANTLCAKAADVALTGIGLELKSVIDQLREQVQNLE